MRHYLDSLIARTVMEPVPSRVVMPRPVSLFEAGPTAAAVAEPDAGFRVADTTTAAAAAAPGMDDGRAGPMPPSTDPAAGLRSAGRPAQAGATGLSQENGPSREQSAAPPGSTRTASGLRSDPIAPTSAGESARAEMPRAPRAPRPLSDSPAPPPVAGMATDVPPATQADSGRPGVPRRAQASTGQIVRDEAQVPARRQASDQDAPRRPVSPGVRASDRATPGPETAALKPPAAAPDSSATVGNRGSHDTLRDGPGPEARSGREVIRPTTQLVPPGAPNAQPKPATGPSAEPAPPVPPVVRITIGRVEVRAVLPPPVEPPPRARPAGPTLSLDDYMKQGRGGA